MLLQRPVDIWLFGNKLIERCASARVRGVPEVHIRPLTQGQEVFEVDGGASAGGMWCDDVVADHVQD
jgi:hypothetical protein